MIHHIVCFRFVPGTTNDQIAAAEDALRGMVGQVPDIRALHWGPNLAPSVGDYSHVLVVELDDMPAVLRYSEHPVHLQVVSEFIAPIREARLALDVEV